MTLALATTPALIAEALGRPMTHRVVTIYANGKHRDFPTRSAPSAENHAIGERRKIGRDLIERDPVTLMPTGRTVRVVSVHVERIEVAA